GWQLHPLECAHGWTPCAIVQRTARTPARRQNGPRSGAHLGTNAATARSAKAEIAESEYCSRFPDDYSGLEGCHSRILDQWTATQAAPKAPQRKRPCRSRGLSVDPCCSFALNCASSHVADRRFGLKH